VVHGELTVIDPEFPEFPESPELSEVAEPLEVAEPVLPELALPEPASVTLPEPDEALPLPPPVVPLVAEEPPEFPEVALVEGFEVAEPVVPEVEVPVPVEEEEVEGGSPAELTLWPLLSEDPELPEVLDDPLVEEAPPVEPVVPEVVVDPVLASPLEAVDEELEVVDTLPVVPPLPESPEVALGSDVASPLLVDPVSPVLPVEMIR
jgi:hypothetical protein